MKKLLAAAALTTLALGFVSAPSAHAADSTVEGDGNYAVLTGSSVTQSMTTAFACTGVAPLEALAVRVRCEFLIDGVVVAWSDGKWNEGSHTATGDVAITNIGIPNVCWVAEAYYAGGAIATDTGCRNP